jgi:23S rRNA (cytosine1962-C5)-methyltransferase
VPDHRTDPLRRVHTAIERRRELAERFDALRLFHGNADGIDGLFIERFGAGATLIVHEGTAAMGLNIDELGRTVLEAASALGVTSVYHKPFVRDRPALGGLGDAVLTSATPLMGPALGEFALMREGEARYEVRLYDGFSTGLFLDQRESRLRLPRMLKMHRGGSPGRVLNTFSYTCSFSVAFALAGHHTASVDVSTRYLEWGKRNFAHSGVDLAGHGFFRRGTLEFLEQAARKGSRWDLVILDPPTFSAGSKAAGASAWSAERDYALLVSLAAAVLAPGGLIYASTNCRALCRGGALLREVERGLGRPARLLDAPPSPEDFPGEDDRAHWILVG